MCSVSWVREEQQSHEKTDRKGFQRQALLSSFWYVHAGSLFEVASQNRLCNEPGLAFGLAVCEATTWPCFGETDQKVKSDHYLSDKVFCIPDKPFKSLTLLCTS